MLHTECESHEHRRVLSGPADGDKPVLGVRVRHIQSDAGISGQHRLNFSQGDTVFPAFLSIPFVPVDPRDADPYVLYGAHLYAQSRHAEGRDDPWLREPGVTTVCATPAARRCRRGWRGGRPWTG